MQHYYDGLEIRPSPLREQQQLDQLNHLLAHVGQYCTGYSSAYRQRRLQDLGELASLPLLNAGELFAAQQAHPPFAGLTGRPASQALRVFA
ncbi:TPA: phenylacetate--CoA ligase, partial [Aeromonas dhakensis]|nr:phenylacetate--CoA ligase [Aeromonas dhakensis]